MGGLVADLPVLLPQVQSGRLRALGVASPQRSALMRDVPTLREQGQALDAFNWYGIIVAAKTPHELVARLNADAVAALSTPAVTQRYAQLGATVVGSTPAELAAHLKVEMERWGPIIKAAGIKADG